MVADAHRLPLVVIDQPLDQGGVEIGANLDNSRVIKPHHPTVPIVESHSIRCGRVRPQLHHSPIAIDKHALDMKLCTSGEDFVQSGERVCVKVLFRPVPPGERMRSLNRPIDVIRDIVKELIASTCFEMRKDLANH
jgi:hypothetical protein